METKYAWDIATSKQFSAKELETINQVSSMIVRGGRVKEIRKKLSGLKLSSPKV
jgi:hypothetical protein